MNLACILCIISYTSSFVPSQNTLFTYVMLFIHERNNEFPCRHCVETQLTDTSISYKLKCNFEKRLIKLTLANTLSQLLPALIKMSFEGRDGRGLGEGSESCFPGDG
jgi:hypothetical protein